MPKFCVVLFWHQDVHILLVNTLRCYSYINVRNLSDALNKEEGGGNINIKQHFIIWYFLFNFLLVLCTRVML